MSMHTHECTVSTVTRQVQCSQSFHVFCLHSSYFLIKLHSVFHSEEAEKSRVKGCTDRSIQSFESAPPGGICSLQSSWSNIRSSAPTILAEEPLNLCPVVSREGQPPPEAAGTATGQVRSDDWFAPAVLVVTADQRIGFLTARVLKPPWLTWTKQALWS